MGKGRTGRGTRNARAGKAGCEAARGRCRGLSKLDHHFELKSQDTGVDGCCNFGNRWMSIISNDCDPVVLSRCTVHVLETITAPKSHDAEVVDHFTSLRRLILVTSVGFDLVVPTYRTDRISEMTGLSMGTLQSSARVRPALRTSRKFVRVLCLLVLTPVPLFLAVSPRPALPPSSIRTSHHRSSQQSSPNSNNPSRPLYDSNCTRGRHALPGLCRMHSDDRADAAIRAFASAGRRGAAHRTETDHTHTEHKHAAATSSSSLLWWHGCTRGSDTGPHNDRWTCDPRGHRWHGPRGAPLADRLTLPLHRPKPPDGLWRTGQGRSGSD